MNNADQITLDSSHKIIALSNDLSNARAVLMEILGSVEQAMQLARSTGSVPQNSLWGDKETIVSIAIKVSGMLAKVGALELKLYATLGKNKGTLKPEEEAALTLSAEDLAIIEHYQERLEAHTK